MEDKAYKNGSGTTTTCLVAFTCTILTPELMAVNPNTVVSPKQPRRKKTKSQMKNDNFHKRKATFFNRGRGLTDFRADVYTQFRYKGKIYIFNSNMTTV